MEELELIVKLSKPYTFDGETYTEIDLSGLEDVTAKQMESVGKVVMLKNKGANPATLEMSMQYALTMAARVAGKPVEFFEGLPARDAISVKTAVVGFLYAGDGED